MIERTEPIEGCECELCVSLRPDGVEANPEPSKHPLKRPERTDFWEQQRERALERDEYECVVCGISDEEHRERDDLWPPNGGLHVHHIEDFDPDAPAHVKHRMENLACLCGSHHRLAHNQGYDSLS